MSKTLSAKCYQENKGLPKNACKRHQNLSKKEKENVSNIAVNVTKMSKKMKNKSLFSVEKLFFFLTKCIKCFWFLGFASYLLKYKKLFKVSISWNIKMAFFRVDISWGRYFYFLSLSWKVQGSFSCNIRKTFFWENIRSFYNIRARKFHFQKYDEFFSGEFFFVFLGLGWEVR